MQCVSVKRPQAGRERALELRNKEESAAGKRDQVRRGMWQVELIKWEG